MWGLVRRVVPSPLRGEGDFLLLSSGCHVFFEQPHSLCRGMEE